MVRRWPHLEPAFAAGSPVYEKLRRSGAVAVSGHSSLQMEIRGLQLPRPFSRCGEAGKENLLVSIPARTPLSLGLGEPTPAAEGLRLPCATTGRSQNR